MLNYDLERAKVSMPLQVKRNFVLAIKNKDFLYNFIGILIKSVLFMLLISDDKANGINLRHVFWSIPPFVVWFAIISLYLSLGFFFKGKLQKWCFFTLNLIFTFIVIGDLWYFRSNSVFLNIHMFSMVSNLDNLGSSIISMIRAVDFLFLIDIMYIAYLNIKKRKTIVFERNLIGGLALIMLCSTYLFYAHIKIDKLEKGFSNQMLFRRSWSVNQTISNITPIGYHIFDGIKSYVESKPYEFTEEEKVEINNVLNDIKEEPKTNEYKGMLKGKNLLLIQWESLETFVVNQKIDGQEITPNLNKLLNNSLYFSNFHEQTWNGTSSDAELIVNAGVLPVREGATFFRFPSNTYENSLPNIFKNLGYSTIASHPDKGSYWNWMANQKSIGYETIYDSTNYINDDNLNLGMSDKTYFKQFGEKLKEAKEPFLAYTITLSSHSPFIMPEDEQRLNLPSEYANSKLGGYFQSINYTDRYLGEFLKYLEEEGILENTAVVIYGDHEGVHKFYNDEIKGLKGTEEWMMENNEKVPFLIYNKDIEGKEFKTLSGQVDTIPTLAYLFGAEEKVWNNPLLLGRNLLTTEDSYVLLSNKTLLEEGLSEEKKEKIKKLTEISDKLIRGNCFTGKVDWLYEK